MELTTEEREGLRQQIALDQASVDRMWNHVDSMLREIASLKAHIEVNERQLRE